MSYVQPFSMADSLKFMKNLGDLITKTTNSFQSTGEPKALENFLDEAEYAVEGAQRKASRDCRMFNLQDLRSELHSRSLFEVDRDLVEAGHHSYYTKAKIELTERGHGELAGKLDDLHRQYSAKPAMEGNGDTFARINQGGRTARSERLRPYLVEKWKAADEFEAHLTVHYSQLCERALARLSALEKKRQRREERRQRRLAKTLPTTHQRVPIKSTIP